MGKAIDLLHSAFTQINDASELFLDYENVMNIFEPLYEQHPEFQEYMDFYKEEKEGNIIGSRQCMSCSFRQRKEIGKPLKCASNLRRLPVELQDSLLSM